MRRLPPNKVEHNVTGLTNLLPEETDELLQRIDQPLQEAMDTDTVWRIFTFQILFPPSTLRAFTLAYRGGSSCFAIIIEMETHTGKFHLWIYLPRQHRFQSNYLWNLTHRSPWSNKYFPQIEDGFLPSSRLRGIEVEANELFDAYRELYYEGGTSSVYLWDLDGGFAGCFLIKKSTFTISFTEFNYVLW